MKKHILCCAAGLAAALSVNANAALLTGTFEGFADVSQYDRTGNITGFVGNHTFGGQTLTGSFVFDLDLAPADSNSSATKNTYNADINWVEIIVDQFFYPTLTPMPINHIKDEVILASGATGSRSFRALDYEYDNEFNPRRMIMQDLSVFSDLFSGGLAWGDFSWTDANIDGADGDYGRFQYRIVGQNSDTGLTEDARGSIVITAVNASFVPDSGTVPAPATALLMLAGVAALGLRRRK